MDMLPDDMTDPVGAGRRPPPGPPPTSGDARVVLVTGGTDGIGRAVALRLAAQGHRVLVTGRDHARGAEVVSRLDQAAPTQGAAVPPSAFFPADLSSMAQTRALADRVTAATDRLDALVCCAGVFTLRPGWTDEGIERSFALNYLSRFLLVQRLLPLLGRSTSGRVVLVANAGRYRHTLDLHGLRRGLAPRGLRLAGGTQFANDVLAVELADRCRGTTLEVTCVNPGVVATDLFRHAPDLPPLLGAALARLAARVGRRPDDAAQVPAWLATDPGARTVSGRFFGPSRTPDAPSAGALRPERRAEIWRFSEELLHGLGRQTAVARHEVPGHRSSG